MEHEEARSQEWAAKIEELVGRAESLADPKAKRVALDLLQVVMEFHAAALDRMMEIVSEAESGAAIVGRIAEDGLSASLLLLHGLHPDDFETRVRRAIDQLQYRLNPRGAGLRLLGTEEGVVRLLYESPRNGNIAAAKSLVEDAIFEMAPEAVDVVIEGLREPAPEGFVPLAALFAGQAE